MTRADLGRYGVGVAWLGSEVAAETVLAFSQAVPGRGVEVSDSALVGGAHRVPSLGFIKNIDRITKRAATEPETRNAEAGSADLVLLKWVRGSGPRG